MNYSISAYPDAAEIYGRLARLVAEPARRWRPT